jgi:hypothetical protein
VLLLRALARKYFRDTRRLRATADLHHLMLIDGDAAPGNDNGTRSDTGALSPLLTRAAERAGWKLELEPGYLILTLA